jgi:hypothetical protein
MIPIFFSVFIVIYYESQKKSCDLGEFYIFIEAFIIKEPVLYSLKV